MATHWIVINGKAKVADGILTYIPSTITEGPNTGRNAITLLRSHMEFESGEVTYEAHLDEQTSKCQVGLKSEGAGTVFAGLNVGTAGYGFSLWQNNKWEILAGAGSGNSVPTDDWISVKLRVLGSQIDLFFGAPPCPWASAACRLACCSIRRWHVRSEDSSRVACRQRPVTRGAGSAGWARLLTRGLNAP